MAFIKYKESKVKGMKCSLNDGVRDRDGWKYNVVSFFYCMQSAIILFEVRAWEAKDACYKY